MSDTWPSAWSEALVAYNASSLSPCLQAATSYAKLGGETIILDPAHRAQALGIAYRWNSRTPEMLIPQYTCHTAHGVYRILTAIGYILKTDYSFNLMSDAGLQNTLSMQGMILTMSLTDLLVRNDISLRLWGGFDRAATVGQADCLRDFIGNCTFKYLRGRNISELWNIWRVNPDDANSATWTRAIFNRLALQVDDMRLFSHVPISVAAWLQWTRKVDTDVALTFKSDYGIVFQNHEDRHAITNAEDSSSRPLLHATLNVNRKAPMTTACFSCIAPVRLPACVDNWQAMTSQHLDNEVNEKIFMSNVLCVSSSYTFLNSNMKGTYLTVSDLVYGKKLGVELCDTSGLEYPDPPTKSFLCPEDLATVSPTGGTQMPQAVHPKTQQIPVPPPETPKPAQIQPETAGTPPPDLAPTPQS